MKRTTLYLLSALLLVGCGRLPQTLNELNSEYVTIDDSIRVHYKIWNETVDSDAMSICFVHGFGCDMNTWEKQFETFCDEKDLQLVFIDLPGYGQSDKPHVDYTLDFFAHAIDEVLKANGIKSNVVFVGHSLGTPVCRHTIMTTNHKGVLVDVDGVYCFYDGTETPEYVEAVNQFGHAFDGPECRDVITGFVSSLAGKDTPQEVMDYAMSVMPETPQYVASSTMQHLVERKWWPDIQLTVPVMVICTQNSGLDPDNKEKMQKLYPHLNYTELTTCGHFIHMEQPEMFNEKLKECIKRSYFTRELNHAFFTDTTMISAEEIVIDPKCIIDMPKITKEEWKEFDMLRDIGKAVEVDDDYLSSESECGDLTVFEDLYSGRCSWYCGGEVKSVTATSCLPPTKSYDYKAGNAHDFSHESVWATKGKGIGESLTYTFEGKCPRITAVNILNGHVKSEKAWRANSRVKKLRMYYNGKPYAILNLQDSRTLQCFDVDTLGYHDETKPDWTLKFEILEVYPGASCDDTVIAELYFDGIDVH